MKFKIRMKLLSDTIFGNGISVPGGEDISILHDENGFPYYKGGTLKGVFREELENYLRLTGEKDPEQKMAELLGAPGDFEESGARIYFSDLEIPKEVQKRILSEKLDPESVLDLFTDIRTFTALDDDGIAETGSLRMARCAIKDISYVGEIECECTKEDEKLITNTLKCIKWIGSMRNRGFGQVMITEVQ